MLGLAADNGSARFPSSSSRAPVDHDPSIGLGEPASRMCVLNKDAPLRRIIQIRNHPISTPLSCCIADCTCISSYPECSCPFLYKCGNDGQDVVFRWLSTPHVSATIYANNHLSVDQPRYPDTELCPSDYPSCVHHTSFSSTMSEYTSTREGFQRAMQWSLSPGPPEDAKAYCEATTTSSFFHIFNDQRIEGEAYLNGLTEWRGKSVEYKPLVWVSLLFSLFVS